MIDTIDIYQQTEHSRGRLSFKPRGHVGFINVMNVVGSSSCKKITGSDQENLITAVGGQTTIDAKDGDDTIVSARRKHVLIGGPGADTYVLRGPELADLLTISIIMGDDEQTITLDLEEL